MSPWYHQPQADTAQAGSSAVPEHWGDAACPAEQAAKGLTCPQLLLHVPWGGFHILSPQQKFGIHWARPASKQPMDLGGNELSRAGQAARAGSAQLEASTLPKQDKSQT